MTSWFEISLKNGEARSSMRPRDAAKLSWTERLLESVLAMNPSLLRLEGELPLSHRGDQAIPDQLYVDELGRLTIVELKAKKATQADLVQALSYAHQLVGQSLEIHMPRLRALGATVATRAGLHLLSLDTETREAAGKALAVDKETSLAVKVLKLERELGGKSGSISQRGGA